MQNILQKYKYKLSNYVSLNLLKKLLLPYPCLLLSFQDIIALQLFDGVVIILGIWYILMWEAFISC